jgi:hypothetical protein
MIAVPIVSGSGLGCSETHLARIGNGLRRRCSTTPPLNQPLSQVSSPTQQANRRKSAPRSRTYPWPCASFGRQGPLFPSPEPLSDSLIPWSTSRSPWHFFDFALSSAFVECSSASCARGFGASRSAALRINSSSDISMSSSSVATRTSTRQDRRGN